MDLELAHRPEMVADWKDRLVGSRILQEVSWYAAHLGLPITVRCCVIGGVIGGENGCYEM